MCDNQKKTILVPEVHNKEILNLKSFFIDKSLDSRIIVNTT